MNFESILTSFLYTGFFPPSLIISIAHYLTLMSKWNRVYNLTAIKNPQEMVIKHILDSLSIKPFIQGHQMIDIGTGAGLPGIPLAIAYPEKAFTLLDCNHKKTQFLSQVKIELELSNVTIVCERAENYFPPSCFDQIITRAFSSIRSTILTTQHLCCPHGTFLAMKGDFPHEELSNLPPGFLVQCIEPLTIPHLAAKRHLIIVSKTNP